MRSADAQTSSDELGILEISQNIEQVLLLAITFLLWYLAPADKQKRREVLPYLALFTTILGRSTLLRRRGKGVALLEAYLSLIALEGFA